MHRIALGKQICSPTIDDQTVIVENFPAKAENAQPAARLRESMIALAQNLDEGLQPVGNDEEIEPPLDSALLAMADTLNTIDRESSATASSDDNTGKHYLVIGRYRVLDEAEKMRTRHADLGTKVRMILHDGALFYQVTAGPFDRPAVEDLEAKLETAGQKVRVAMLCADGVTPAPCNDGAATQTALSADAK